MTKEQFIMELEQCLQGEVSAYELSDSLTYYRQYFEDEIRNGKSEEQVVEELGSPRLIARSIIDAHGIEESASGNSDYGDNSYCYIISIAILQMDSFRIIGITA